MMPRADAPAAAGAVWYGPMAPADAPGAAAIEAGVADGWSLAGIEGALAAPAARCWCARAGGQVAAFAAFTCAADEASLDALSVAPAWRRRGLARGLLTAALAALAAEGAAACYLEVRRSNTPARALYAALGFAPVGLRPRFYENPAEDAVLMKKEL